MKVRGSVLGYPGDKANARALWFRLVAAVAASLSRSAYRITVIIANPVTLKRNLWRPLSLHRLMSELAVGQSKIDSL